MKNHASQSFIPLSNEVFVGNLSFFCHEQDLLKLFQDHCTVQEVRIMRSEYSHRTLMYGFVTFSSIEEAKEMAKLLNNHFFMGRRLKVETSDRKTSHLTALHQHRSQQVHVSFSSGPTCQQLCVKPTEILLRKYFMPFGGLFDVAVKEYHISADGRHQEGYAFLTFENAASASTVIKQGMFLLDGLELRCTAPLPSGQLHRDTRGTHAHPAQMQAMKKHGPNHPLIYPDTLPHSSSPPQREMAQSMNIASWLSPEFPLPMDMHERERESTFPRTSFNALAGSLSAHQGLSNHLSPSHPFDIYASNHDDHHNTYDKNARLRSLSLSLPFSEFQSSSHFLTDQLIRDRSPSDSDKSASSASSSGRCSMWAEGPAHSPYCPALSLSL